MKKNVLWLLAGAAAGSVSGLFGAGGGMVLVPLLGKIPEQKDEAVFPASVAIILPICLVSILIGLFARALSLSLALPYLPGSALGGALAGLWGQKIPVKWLHRGLGLLILWGGIRYLC